MILCGEKEQDYINKQIRLSSAPLDSFLITNVYKPPGFSVIERTRLPIVRIQGCFLDMDCSKGFIACFYSLDDRVFVFVLSNGEWIKKMDIKFVQIKSLLLSTGKISLTLSEPPKSWIKYQDWNQEDSDEVVQILYGSQDHLLPHVAAIIPFLPSGDIVYGN